MKNKLVMVSTTSGGSGLPKLASSAPEPLSNVTDIPRVYLGAPFHARGFAIAGVYRGSWEPPARSAWIVHPYVAETWAHPGFPRHVLRKRRDGLLVFTQLSSSTPNERTLFAFARSALGPQAMPVETICFPIALRLPLRATTATSIPIPSGGFRCRRLWPLIDNAAHIEVVETIDTELRVTGSRGARGVSLYAEAFIARAFETWDGAPRSLLFPADASRLLDGPRGDLVRFTTRLMDRLLVFAYYRRDQGLDIDHRRLQGRLVGRVQIAADGDTEYRVRLPQPSGVLKAVVSTP